MTGHGLGQGNSSLEDRNLGITTGVPSNRQRTRSTRVPEEHPRHNGRKSAPATDVVGVRPSPPKGGKVARSFVDLGAIQRSGASDDLVCMPTVITKRPQPDFPFCADCCPGHEMTIEQDGPGAERVIMCPKHPRKQRDETADWTPVRSTLAQNCDGRGRAAIAAVLEARERAQEKEKEITES